MEQLYDTLSSQTSKQKSELQEIVQNKVKELSGLVSEEGAIYIVANELGVKLDLKPASIGAGQDSNSYMKIEQITEPRVSLNMVVKVLKKYDLIEFDMKSGGKGQIRSLLVGDETGIVRVAFWGSKADLLEEVERDSILDIKNVYVRENVTNGRMEVHFGDYSEFTLNPEGIGDIEVKQIRPQSTPKQIEEIELEDKNVSIKATIVDVDIPRFYLGCPHTFKKVFVDEGKYISPEHGEVEPIRIPITNIVVNDSSGTIGVVAFRDRAEELFSKKSEEIVSLAEDLEAYREISKELVGSQIEVIGNVSENQMTGEMQIIINDVVFVEKKSESEIADDIVKESSTATTSSQSSKDSKGTEEKSEKKEAAKSNNSQESEEKKKSQEAAFDDDLEIEEIDFDDDF